MTRYKPAVQTEGRTRYYAVVATASACPGERHGGQPPACEAASDDPRSGEVCSDRYNFVPLRLACDISWHDLASALQAFGAIAGVVGTIVAFRTLRLASDERETQRLDEIAELLVSLKLSLDVGGNVWLRRADLKRLRNRVSTVKEKLPKCRALVEEGDLAATAENAELVEEASKEVAEALMKR